MNKIVSLPFFHGSCEDRDNDGFPPELPIEIYFDNELRMFRCWKSDLLQETLNNVYRKGSLCDGSISSESGGVYVYRLVEFLTHHGQLNERSRILEIGFGKGVILKKLQELGFENLIGVEPGNHHLLPGMEGIEMINDFFPSNQISGKLDTIFHFAVWEHVDDPVTFIQDQMVYLNKEGSIIFGVPNCEPYLRDGDVSMFIHEHFSYFTKESILECAGLAGGTLEHIEIIEGMLVGKISKRRNDLPSNGKKYLEFEENEFWNKAGNLLESLKSFFSNYCSEENVAVYAPGRGMNALYILGLTNVRLVDDNSEMRNRHLPCFERPVESFEDICSTPPNAILIYSSTFGERIKVKCLNEKRLSGTRIVTLDELKA